MYWAHLGPKKPNTTKTMAIKKKKYAFYQKYECPDTEVFTINETV